jgi:hypothetical protein
MRFVAFLTSEDALRVDFGDCKHVAKASFVATSEYLTANGSLTIDVVFGEGEISLALRTCRIMMWGRGVLS